MDNLDIDISGDRFIKEISNSIRSLQFLEVLNKGDRTWVEIQRSPKGKYRGYVLAGCKMLKDIDWGIFFNGCESNDRY